LKLKYDKLLSSCAFNFKFRPYNVAEAAEARRECGEEAGVLRRDAAAAWRLAKELEARMLLQAKARGRLRTST